MTDMDKLTLKELKKEAPSRCFASQFKPPRFFDVSGGGKLFSDCCFQKIKISLSAIFPTLVLRELRWYQKKIFSKFLEKESRFKEYVLLLCVINFFFPLFL